MNIYKELPKFKPVTVVLENQQEFSIFVDAIKAMAARGGDVACEMADMIDDLIQNS